MTLVIHSIHEQASNLERGLEDLVSRAFFAASVLGQKPVRAWLKCERDGYAADDPVPGYRQNTRARLIAWFPGRDWVEAPISDELNDAVTAFALHEGIGAIERAYAESRKTVGQRLDLSEERQAELRRQVNMDCKLALAVPSLAFARTLEGVRLAIDLWSRQLIDAGVKGRGTSFSNEERAIAKELSEGLPDLLAEATAAADRQLAATEQRHSGLLTRLLGKKAPA